MGTGHAGEAVDEQRKDEDVGDAANQGAEEGRRCEGAGGRVGGRFWFVGGDANVACYKDYETGACEDENVSMNIR